MDLDTKFNFHSGKNTARVLDIGKGQRGRAPRNVIPDVQVFRVRLANLYYQYLPLIYVVPHGAALHPIIKDLQYFYTLRDQSGKAAKPWIEVTLQDNHSDKPGMQFSIIGLKPIENPSFEEIDELSLRLRKELDEQDLGSRARLFEPGIK